MKKNRDEYRRILDEVETMIDKERFTTSKLVKQAYKDSVSFKSLAELFKEQRRKFDYAFANLFAINNVGEGDVRNKLDIIWEEVFHEQPPHSKYTRILHFVGFPDTTDNFRREIWDDYLNSALKLAKELLSD